MDTIIEAIRKNIEKSLGKNQAPFYTYMIGNNGTGKSRILSQLAQIYEADMDSPVKIIPCISNTLYDRFQIQPGQKILYLGCRSVGNAVFHAAIDRQLAKFLFSGISTKPGFLRSLETTLNVRFAFRLNANQKYTASDSIDSLVDKRKLRFYNINDHFDSIERRVIGDYVDRTLTVRSLSRRAADVLSRFMTLNPSISIFVRRSDGEYDFRDLSSGEQNRILLAVKILSAAQRYSLIIIDEPEISLHLHWQMDFHSLVRQLLLKIKNFHVVIATHSPVIVSEATKDSSSDSIVVLDGSGGAVDEEALGSSKVFRKIQANSVQSYDELVLDLFDTVTYNARSVSEEIADSMLRVASGRFDIDGELKKLKALLSKKGLTRDDAATTDKALRLLKRHFSKESPSADAS